MSQNLKNHHERVLELLSQLEKPIEFCDESFVKQTAFIKDPSKFKAGFCTRRAGKSYAAGIELAQSAYDNDSVSCLYVALTRDSAKRIMFRDVLGQINNRYSLGGQPNLTDLSYTFPNNSTITLLGMDSKPEEAEKALGQKFKKIVIDEAGSFRRDLRQIIYGIFSPACADLGGTISMIGTPTNLTKGFYYDVVWAKTEPGWSTHSWTAYDNPYMVEQWTKEIADLKAKNPLVVETPWFKQMYMGEYVVDKDALVYKYSESRNSSDEVPDDLVYVLGIDLGFDDASAFTVCGYNKFDSSLYIIETYKKSGMIISDVAERIKYFQNKYNPYRLVVDNASKQAVEELKRRFSLPLTAADKSGKAEFIEIMNSELIQGRVKVLSGNDLLLDEWSNLIWDERSSRREEHSACDNHLADSTLYAWRYCYQYLSKPKEPLLTDKQKVDLFFETESEKVMQTDKTPFWERDWQ